MLKKHTNCQWRFKHQLKYLEKSHEITSAKNSNLKHLNFDTPGIKKVQMDNQNTQNSLPNQRAEDCTTTISMTPVDNRKPNVYKSKMFFIAIGFSGTLLLSMTIAFILHYTLSKGTEEDTLRYWHDNLSPEQQHWYKKGVEELKIAMRRKLNERRARNVILFVGDGMGPNTVTASRIYGFKEEGLMSWERFPHMALLKTYCANKQVPDSFSTATALFGGVKANYETGGVDSNVQLANCSASLKEAHHVQTIIKWAQNDGMNTGFVTTTRVTHATPAALYAHVPDRRWECEERMPAEAHTQGCKDIARQLIEETTGRRINVIMGGGRQMLVSNVEDSPADPVDKWACYSKDGRNLIQDWKNLRAAKGDSYTVVQNTGELLELDGEDFDYVMGIFANGHLKYEHERDKTEAGMPSLKEMTLKAIEVLKSKDKGFLLVVEGGMIDQAHHRGTARKALNEVLALNEAVKATVGAMKQQLAETLIIVTADHSHSLTINGHPERGSNILGMAGNSRTEGTPYTTLTYGTSYKGFQADLNGTRANPAKLDTTDWEYTQQAAINTDENLHGGSDVTLHAMGPFAHLFHSVHEQSYVAHVIAYASRIGRFRDSTIAESLADIVS